MAVIELEVFNNNDEDFDGALVITHEGEFVVVTLTMIEEGVGTFELAKLKIHYSVAREIGVEGVAVKHALEEE